MKSKLALLAKQLGKGTYQEIEDGKYLTFCPVCNNHSVSTLKIWEGPDGEMRGHCKEGCKFADIKTRLKQIERRPPDIHSDGFKGFNLPPVSNVCGPEKEKRDAGYIERLMLSMDDLIEMEIPENKMLVSPFLRQSSISMFYSKPGTGKTWVGMGLAVALTRMDFQNIEIGPWRVVNQTGVLYIDGEMELGEMLDRALLFKKTMGRESDKFRLHFLSNIQVEEDEDETIDIENVRWRDRITQHFIDDPNTRLLVLDNLGCLAPFINENSSTKLKQILDWLRELKRMGVAVILLHHMNKLGQESGSSHIKRPMSSVMCLEKVSETEDNVNIKIHFDKCRGLKPGEGRDIHLELVGDEETGLQFVQRTDIG